MKRFLTLLLVGFSFSCLGGSVALQFGSAMGAAKHKTPPSTDPYFGILVFTNVTALTMNAADIAAVNGNVVQRTSAWTEVHGHNCYGLKHLDVFGNALTVVDLVATPAMITLDVSVNSLVTLNTSGLATLVVFKCNDNVLTALDVTQMSNLISLECNGNQLTTLDVSGNPNLLSLWAYDMAIPAIDISNNPKLTTIDLGGNTMLPAAVDDILIKLDGFGLSGGSALMFATAVPTPASAAARTNLLNRGWTLQLD